MTLREALSELSHSQALTYNPPSRETLALRIVLASADITDKLAKALESIALNTCCDRCQEAALVAREALMDLALATKP